MDIMMSQKEAKRAQVMELLTAGEINQKEAGQRLAVSVRQIKRIVRRYRETGLAGLISKKRGHPSNRRLNEETKRLSIELIGTHYHDFGPTLVCEKLAERHDIHLCVESTRQIMMAAGYWQPRTGAKACVHPALPPRALGRDDPDRWQPARQTLQDRLVKEMCLAGINDLDSANAWLPGYIADYNRRFAVAPKDGQDAHLPYQGTAEALTGILSVQVERTLSKNL